MAEHDASAAPAGPAVKKVLFLKEVAAGPAVADDPTSLPEALQHSRHSAADLDARVAYFKDVVATDVERSYRLLPKFLWQVDRVPTELVASDIVHDHRLFYNEEQKRLAIMEHFLAYALGPRESAAAAWEAYLTGWTRALPDWHYSQVLLGKHLVATGQHAQAVSAFRVAYGQKPSSPLIEDLYRRAVCLAVAATPDHGLELSNIERAFLRDLRGRFCEKPFSNFEVWNTGAVYVCCGQWVPAPIGNVFTQTADEIWNSQVAQDIRQSIHDGSYKYCSRTCPSIVEHGLWHNDGIAAAAIRYEDGEATAPEFSKQAMFALEAFSANKLAEGAPTALTRGPLFVNMAHDATCNLSCPSCRTEVRAADSATRDRLDIVRDRVFDSVVPGAMLLKIAGDGDPFASKHYREILASLDAQRMPHLRLDLLTNGVLLTPAEWRRFANIIPLLELVEISIDAATPETYAVVRRGGDWDKLLDNLAHMSRMHAEGQIPTLQLNYVVQSRNFREMKAFVELGLRLQVSRISFANVHNGLEAFKADEFNQANVFDPQHPDHAEFKAMLDDPIFTRPEVMLPSP